MFRSNKSKLAKSILQQGVNNAQRYYASTIQLPFHPHYVPPGQPTTTSIIRKQNNLKGKNFSKTSSNPSTTFGIYSFNHAQHSQPFPISVLNNTTNSMILGLVPTINRLQKISFSKKDDVLLSTNFFGDTSNEATKRKIPFLFRISTICFVVAGFIRSYHRRKSNSNLHNGNDDYRIENSSNSEPS
ncbi:3254_t:CDS:1 [Funneliformis mosseae]|uniref:3254_t:CDS:1 n=1 Tax=Funneliformis mosseae TaxID=27381 RepID=A0A9N9BY73_FUNMO|nr:3254_t:CDS:1 [Funneliformis mosseae]